MANTKRKKEDDIVTNEKKETTLNEVVIPEKEKIDTVDGDYNATATKDPTVFTDLEYTSTKPMSEDITEAYLNYKKKTKLPRIIDIVSMVLTLGVILTSLILLFIVGSKNNTVLIVSLSVTGAVLVGSFVLSRVFSKKKTLQTTQYLKAFESILNGNTLSTLNVKEGKLSVAGKIDDQDVIRTHYFATINSIQSRGVVEGKRKDKGFRGGEVAVIVPSTPFAEANRLPEKYIDLHGNEVNVEVKQEVPVSKETTTTPLNLFKKKTEPNEIYLGLFGKLFSYDLMLDSSQSIIVAIKGKYKSTYLPNYLTGFEAIKIDGLDENIIVYAVDIASSKKFFDKKGIELLNKIKITEDFTSGFISANSYGVRVGLNLSDRVMQLPLDEKVSSSNAFDNYIEATKNMFAFVDHMETKLK